MMQTVRTIKVFLLDDHEIVRRGLRELLENEDDMEVVGEAGTAEQAIGRIPACQPDVATVARCARPSPTCAASC
jgi:two-component system, NarL family, response regulator DevR